MLGVEIAKNRFAFDQTCRDTTAKKFAMAKILSFRKVIFLGTKFGELTVVEVKTGDSQLSEAQEKGSGNWEEAAMKWLSN